MKLFCAEALWDNEISQNRSTYKSLMQLVRNETGCTLAYFTFNTPEELEYLVEVFHKKNYDILYIASHMENGNIKAGLNQKFDIDYKDLILKNSDKFKDKIVHLAGCSSLSKDNMPNGADIVSKSGLKALSGYKIDTYTTESSAMDLLYLTSVINRGYVYATEISEYSDLIRLSGFVVDIRKED